MQVSSFIANSVSEAVAQIRAELGPEAVVLNVRNVPATGWARLWQKPRLEVLACRPETPAAGPGLLSDELASVRQEIAALKEQIQLENSAAGQFPRMFNAPSGLEDSASNEAAPTLFNAESRGSDPPRWRVELLLENAGLLPLQAKRLLDIVQARHGEAPPASLNEELAMIRRALVHFWRPSPPLESSRPQILVGPAGVGKTTALCKWLTQTALVEGRKPRVCRLDGACANNAAFLSLHGEILGLQIERAWPVAQDFSSTDQHFIDLPGVDWRNPAAVRRLGEQVQSYGPAQLHLVLNAAYDVPVLLAQVRAFESLPIADLIFTHLDEEPCWGKLWNFLLATNFPLRFLSAGQNIPGQFHEATPEQLFKRLFPSGK